MKKVVLLISLITVLLACNKQKSSKVFSNYVSKESIESISFHGENMEAHNEDDAKVKFLENLMDASLSPVRNFKEGTYFFDLKIKGHNQIYTAKINKKFVAIDAKAFGEKSSELKADSSQFEIVWELE